MATLRQVEIYKLFKDTCLGNGFGQTSFRHRQLEGTLQAAPGFPNNTIFKDAPPRSQDNTTDPPINIWMTWIPRKLMGISDAAGDTKAFRNWVFRDQGECPAIDDNGNQINIQDEDFGVDPFGNRFRIENPALSPDGSSWHFEMVRNK